MGPHFRSSSVPACTHTRGRNFDPSVTNEKWSLTFSLICISSSPSPKKTDLTDMRNWKDSHCTCLASVYLPLLFEIYLLWGSGLFFFFFSFLSVFFLGSSIDYVPPVQGLRAWRPTSMVSQSLMRGFWISVSDLKILTLLWRNSLDQ